MTELIKIETNEKDEQLVSGRLLHEKLEVNTRYSDWIKRRIEDYDLIENEDWSILKFEHTQNKQIYDDHILKLDIAKELCMAENNEKGKQIRKYFIECEKIAKEKVNKPLTTKELLMLNQLKIEELENINNQLTEVLDTIQTYGDNLLFRDFIKVVYNEHKINISEKEFRNLLKNKKYIDNKNMPYSQYKKYFNVNKGVKNGHAWTTTRLTAKGQLYFTNKLLKMF